MSLILNTYSRGIALFNLLIIKFQSTFTDTIFLSYYKQYKILLGKKLYDIL